MLTSLERSAIDLLVELEAALATGYNLPPSAITAMSRLKANASTPAADELQRIYRFAKICLEENLIVTGQNNAPKLTLINPGNKAQKQE